MNPTIAVIQRATAQVCGITVEDLKSQSRLRKFARPRQMAMLACVSEAGKTVETVGQRFGGRDHTTVCHAKRVTSELIAKDFEEMEKYREIVALAQSEMRRISMEANREIIFKTTRT